MTGSFKNRINRFLSRIRTYNEIANVNKITRRYFAINGFDGVITIIGVLVGNYIINVQDYKNVIIAGLAICISLGVSGIWSAYSSESAERKKELEELEKSTLSNLNKTVIYDAQRYASIVLALVNGLSPVGTAFVPLIPFFFGGLIGIQNCYYIGFGLAFAILLGIGLFLGRISRSNLIISGIKMIAAGLFCVAVSFLLTFI